MSITLFLPFLFGVIFFVAVARTAFHRPRRRKIDSVIPFVRKLDVSELEDVRRIRTHQAQESR